MLPAGINAIVAGVGWFAVNSISGALALSALTGWNGYVCLVIGVALMLAVAFLGYNFVHVFERFTSGGGAVCGPAAGAAPQGGRRGCGRLTVAANGTPVGSESDWCPVRRGQ